MSKYNYSFARYGSLFRSKGIPLTDANDNYISGEPQFVWWWPINWFVIAIGIPLLALIRLFRKEK